MHQNQVSHVSRKEIVSKTKEIIEGDARSTIRDSA